MTDPREQRTYEIRIDLRAPRDAVWEAIATDAGLRRWFAPEARVDLREGGELVWNWPGHHEWIHRIEVVEPGARLRTRYDSAVDDGSGGKRPLFVDFLLEGEGGTTTLRLVQSGFGPEADFDAEYDGIRRGWPVELRSLRLALERHPGRERRIAWATTTVELDPPEAWRRLTGPRGLGCGAHSEDLEEGEPFAFATAQGDRFTGRALECHVGCLSVEVEAFGGAFLRASVDPVGRQTLVSCWLAAWDASPSELDALERRLTAMLERLFPTPARGLAQT